jgi:hypothetical protein
MNRMAAALAALLSAAMPGRGAAAPADSAIPGEDLFKWGEYDSLIRVLEPEARASGEARTRQDSLRQAKSLLFLGVAFCATGNPERADQAFSRSVELDPQVELDRFYVTAEIANRFQATALRALRNRPPIAPGAPVARAASPAPAAADPSRPTPSVHGLSHSALAPKPTWIWIGAGAAAALAAATGYILFTERERPSRDEVTAFDLH